VSVGLGLVAATVGKAVAAGSDLDVLVAKAEAVRENVRVFGSTPSLKHAVRGGRVDAKVAWVLEHLGIKPLIHFDPLGKPYKGGVAIGFKAAMRKLARQAAAWAGSEPVRALVVHANAPASGRYLAERAQRTLGLAQVEAVQAGSVLGIHVGPGAVAIAVQRRAELL
jgi:DegV family protein with EDD domain